MKAGYYKTAPLFLVLFFFFYNTHSYAQSPSEKENTFSISAQIRPRAEWRNGTFQPLTHAQKPAVLVSQRNRLQFLYQYKQKLTLQLSPQQVVIWGQDGLTQNAGNSNGIAFFDAWAQWHFDSSTSIQIGRQVLSLDDERIMGALDWAQGARAHDGIALNYNNHQWDAKLFAAYNQNYKELYGNNTGNASGSLYSPRNATPYKWMQTAWGRYKINSAHSLSGLLSNWGFQNALHAADTAKNYCLLTTGLHYSYSAAALRYHASAYTQWGHNAQGVKTNAYLLSAGLGYQPHLNWNLQLAADFVSGNSYNGSAQNINRAFNPMLGTNHKFYGAMDYYFAGNGHKNTGLTDVYFKTGYQSTKQYSVQLALHQFYSAGKIKDAVRKYKANLGQELDIDFNYAMHKFVKLTGGYSLYLTTPSILFLKSVAEAPRSQHWGWLAINIHPQLFKTKYN